MTSLSLLHLKVQQTMLVTVDLHALPHMLRAYPDM